MASDYGYTFTVFTATFNRAHTLHRVYESLTRQTFRDFEWFVVDDGSTDKTESLVLDWQREASFPIRYVWQENAGKPSATNRGARLAEGELFLRLDSDDACLPHALERFKHHWESIPKSQRSDFLGVAGLVQRPDGKLEGTPFPSSPCDSTSLEILRHGVRGEKWGFVRTAVMREFPFPVLRGERFLPESVVWYRMARLYRTRFINEMLRIRHREEENLSDPLARILNPQGAILSCRERIAAADVLTRSIVFRACANRVRFGLHAGEGLSNQLQELPSPAYQLGALVAGLALYIRDQRYLRRRKHPGD